jgi:hypothetical protein
MADRFMEHPTSRWPERAQSAGDSANKTRSLQREIQAIPLSKAKITTRSARSARVKIPLTRLRVAITRNDGW